METLPLPVAFSPEPPEGGLVQDSPRGLGNFAAVLEKQYSKEGNPPQGVPQIFPGDFSSAAMATTSLAPIQVPHETVFPEERPVSDRASTAPPEEEYPPSSPMEQSSLFLLSKPFPGPEPGPEAKGTMGEEKAPIPVETPSPSLARDRDGGTPPTPFFLLPEKGEKNQARSPGEGKISGKAVEPNIQPSSLHPSMGQESSRTLQGIPALPDSSPSPVSWEEPLQRKLATNMKMGMGGAVKAENPIDSSSPTIPLEEPIPMESTGKRDTLSGNEKKTPLFSDSPISPASLEGFPQSELAGKRVISLEGEKRDLHPRPLPGNNGPQERPVKESVDYSPHFQPSQEVEAESRNSQGQVVRKIEFSFGGAKEASEGKNPQIMKDEEGPVGPPAQVMDPKAKELGVLFSGKAGTGQEKALWSGILVHPLPETEIQSHPSFSGALTDPLNRNVENGGKIMEASPSLSPKPETPSVFQQVGQRVLWLIRNHEEKIRISLEPPELGQVFLEIDRHKEHVKTVLWTDNPTTKAILESSQGGVQKIIESEGFKLEKFSVFVQQDPGWFQSRKENPGKEDSWKARTPGEERGSSANSVDSIPGRTPGPHPSSRYLDLLV